jgi:hypothetical protein
MRNKIPAAGRMIECAVDCIDELERQVIAVETKLADYAATLEKQLRAVDAILAPYKDGTINDAGTATNSLNELIAVRGRAQCQSST